MVALLQLARLDRNHYEATSLSADREDQSARQEITAHTVLGGALVLGQSDPTAAATFPSRQTWPSLPVMSLHEVSAGSAKT